MHVSTSARGDFFLVWSIPWVVDDPFAALDDVKTAMQMADLRGLADRRTTKPSDVAAANAGEIPSGGVFVFDETVPDESRFRDRCGGEGEAIGCCVRLSKIVTSTVPQ